MIHSIPKNVWNLLTTVLVDFDGTLADSYPRLYLAYKTFMELNGKVANMDDFKELIGYTLPEVVEKISEKHHLKSPPQQLLESYRTIMKQVYNHEIKIFPGALEVLQFLRKKQLTLAMVTAADRSLVEPFLERHGIRDYFKLIVAPTGNMPGKPAPDLYKHALNLLGINSTQAIALEDSITGIASATGAGIYTILIRNFLHEKLEKEYFNVIEAQNWEEVGKIFGNAII